MGRSHLVFLLPVGFEPEASCSTTHFIDPLTHWVLFSLSKEHFTLFWVKLALDYVLVLSEENISSVELYSRIVGACYVGESFIVLRDYMRTWIYVQSEQCILIFRNVLVC